MDMAASGQQPSLSFISHVPLQCLRGPPTGVEGLEGICGSWVGL